MKKVKIISFDLIRQKDLNESLAISYLLADLMDREGYNTDFTAEHLSFNLYDHKASHFSLSDFDLTTLLDCDTIAIGAYVWSDYLTNPFIALLRKAGYQNKIVLGGYQISYSSPENLAKEYPGCDIFITVYAEASIYDAILMEKPARPVILNTKVNFERIASPYLQGIIKISDGQQMVRMITKRGCKFGCKYCAHRDLVDKSIHTHNLSTTFNELALFRENNVKRVNILDPLFNFGDTYLTVLEEIERLHFCDTTFTLQTRPELIRGNEGRRFLELAKSTNSHLEFGIQTIHKIEAEAIGRYSKIESLKPVFDLLNQYEISYEASIIYGLPNQTLNSFTSTIETLQSAGLKKICAYPLMLLKGTELYAQKGKWNLKEMPLGDYRIPTVCESNSFSFEEWIQMDTLATNLMAS